MKRLFIFTLLLLSVHKNIYAQNDERLLLYANGSDFLVPYIEKVVSNLKDTSNGLKLFKSIKNLNRINLLKNTETITRETIDYYANNELLTETSSVDSAKKLLADEILQHDVFLLLRINTLGSFVEVQFLRYDVVPPDNSKKESDRTTQIGRILELRQSENLIINLESSSIQDQILFALNSLFPNSNKVPIAFISNGQNISENNVTIGTNENLTLFGDLSYDQETKTPDLKYNWQIIDTTGIKPLHKHYGLTSNKLDVVFVKPGTYTIQLVVSDGVKYSNVARCLVNVGNRPNISIIPKEIHYDAPLIFSKRIKSRLIIFDSSYQSLTGSLLEISLSKKIDKTREDQFHSLLLGNQSNSNRSPYTKRDSNVKVIDILDTLNALATSIIIEPQFSISNPNLKMQISVTKNKLQSDIEYIPITLAQSPAIAFFYNWGYLQFNGVKRNGNSLDSIAKQTYFSSIGIKLKISPTVYFKVSGNSLRNDDDSSFYGFFALAPSVSQKLIGNFFDHNFNIGPNLLFINDGKNYYSTFGANRFSKALGIDFSYSNYHRLNFGGSFGFFFQARYSWMLNSRTYKTGNFFDISGGLSYGF